MAKIELSDTRGVKITLVSYALLFCLQIAAYYLTGILVMLAGAFDTLSDIINSGCLLIAIHWSHMPADQSHMFGYTRVQSVAAVLAGTIFISYLSLEMFRRAIMQLFNPAPAAIQNIPLAAGVAAIALTVTSIPLYFIFRQKQRETAVQEQLVALLENGGAYIVSMIALVFVAAGYYIADAVASFLIAILIALSGAYLLKDNIAILVGVAPPREYLDDIRKIVLSVDGVLGMHNLYAEYIGRHTFRTGFHIVVKNGTPIEEADRIAREVKKRVLTGGGCCYCMIHVEPVTKIDEEEEDQDFRRDKEVIEKDRFFDPKIIDDNENEADRTGNYFHRDCREDCNKIMRKSQRDCSPDKDIREDPNPASDKSGKGGDELLCVRIDPILLRKEGAQFGHAHRVIPGRYFFTPLFLESLCRRTWFFSCYIFQKNHNVGKNRPSYWCSGSLSEVRMG